MAWWLPVLEVAGAALSTFLDNEAADDAADKEREGQEKAIGLQRDVYRDQRALALPNYLTGGAATNKLASMFNIGPQDYGAAAAGDPTSQLSTGYDWNSYIAGSPDLQAEWNRNAKLRAMYGNDITRMAQDHYKNFGQREGRQLGSPGGGTYSPTGSSAQPAPNALSSSFDMNEFWGSPYGQLATEQFLGADNPQIKGAFATQGKALSGAQQIALSDRGRARAGGAFGDYTNSLRSLAGLNQVAGSAISGAAGTYGANAGQGLIDIGQIGADKTRALNDNWKTFGKNALSGYV